MPRPNPLEQFFRANRGPLIDKWIHYFDIYDRHLSPYRGRPITVVEFGVQHGGSMRMWRDYLGRKARIFGIDIDPRCAAVAAPGSEILIGDQSDPAFLASVRERVGTVDVLIEDGGHTMDQQLTTFREMWPAIGDGGVFLIEDLHTSYWPTYGGGYATREPSSSTRRA